MKNEPMVIIYGLEPGDYKGNYVGWYHDGTEYHFVTLVPTKVNNNYYLVQDNRQGNLYLDMTPFL